MSNPWDHYPNAKHIDKVLAHVKANPDKWNNDKAFEQTAMWNEAWFALQKDAWDEVWATITLHAPNWGISRWSVPGVLHALITYDDCGYMLDFTPEQIHLYACLGMPAAVLLEPAVRVMNNHE